MKTPEPTPTPPPAFVKREKTPPKKSEITYIEAIPIASPIEAIPEPEEPIFQLPDQIVQKL